MPSHVESSGRGHDLALILPVSSPLELNQHNPTPLVSKATDAQAQAQENDPPGILACDLFFMGGTTQMVGIKDQPGLGSLMAVSTARMGASGVQ